MRETHLLFVSHTGQMEPATQVYASTNYQTYNPLVSRPRLYPWATLTRVPPPSLKCLSVFGIIFFLIFLQWTCKSSNHICSWEEWMFGHYKSTTRFYPWNDNAVLEFPHFPNQISLQTYIPMVFIRLLLESWFLFLYSSAACFLEKLAQWCHATLSHKIIQILGSWYNEIKYNTIIETNHFKDDKIKLSLILCEIIT